jgi:hypothetical protein
MDDFNNDLDNELKDIQIFNFIIDILIEMLNEHDNTLNVLNVINDKLNIYDKNKNKNKIKIFENINLTSNDDIIYL